MSKGLNMHIMENLAEKTVTYRVKPVALSSFEEMPR
jgi:hypothetical protein